MKRLLALLLCLVMCVSLIPAAAAEDIEIIEIEPEDDEIITLVDPEEPIVAPGDEIAASKPTITASPESVTAYVGTTVTFTVEATGATSYQWYYRTSSSGSWSKSTASSATTNALSVTAEAKRNGYQYRCKVSNSSGYVYSDAATLTVSKKPIITAQPESTTIVTGGTAKFTVEAEGATGYQWYWRENAEDSWHKATVSTGTKATLVYSNLSSSKSGRQYKCKVTNDAGYVYSAVATLTVSKKPVITSQPESLTIGAGGTAKFTVAAEGATAYQWYYRANKDDSWHKATVSSGTKSTLVYTNLSSSKSGRQYKCKVSSAESYAYSAVVILTVLAKPAITAQPASLTIRVGETARFTVAAEGATGYQWYYRANAEDSWHKSTVSTGTKATLVYTNLSADKNGRQYKCKVSNAEGYVYSKVATLTVSEKPVITTEPLDQTVGEGGQAVFTVVAEEATEYQWYRRANSGSSWRKLTVPSATEATLVCEKINISDNGAEYRCKVSNEKGYVYSKAAVLTVSEIPTVIHQPLSVTASVDAPVVFEVSALRAESYQWQYRTGASESWKNSALSGNKTKALKVSASMSRNGYQYRCVLSNAEGSVYSAEATLSVSEGTCGSGLYWIADSSGLLTIGGDGPMASMGRWSFNEEEWGEEFESFAPWGLIPYDRVIIMEGVTKIGTGAFLSQIKWIYIPDDVYVDSYAFLYCDVENVIFGGSATVEENAFEGAKQANVFYHGPESRYGNVNIRDDDYGVDPFEHPLRRYPHFACEHCGCLGEELFWVLDSSGNLFILGSGDMQDFSADELPPWKDFENQILTVRISKRLTRIGDHAFDGCSKLDKVYYLGTEDQWNEIEIGADNAPLINAPIFILGQFAEWGNCGENHALYWTVDDNKHLVISGNGNMLGIDDYYFDEDYEDEYLDDHEIDHPWKTDILSVLIEDGVKSIGYGAFMSCSRLTSIDIPDSVTIIGRHAFDGCSGLTSVTIPDNVTKLGPYAFKDCSGLTSVTIGKGVTYIGRNAFDGCSSLTDVTIPNNVTRICLETFCNCGKLKRVTIPNSVSVIAAYAFYGCSRLTDVHYIGTEAQWSKIYIDEDGNDRLLAATMHYNA